jgi:hypothetical protein
MNKGGKTKNPWGNKYWRQLKYAAKCLPVYGWQRLTRTSPKGQVHVMIAVADHFEPSNVPGHEMGYAPAEVQEQRLETWCGEYPRNFADLRDSDGRPFTHTYFYPAEQYNYAQVDRLAQMCHSGWGEIEVHLHHGIGKPATEEETRERLFTFRNALAYRHGCLAYDGGSREPKYIFVHGNFALANSTRGRGCGVDNEMQVLAETGCYADLTYPASVFHPAQVAKLNSIYECALPFQERAPQRRGRDLQVGHSVTRFPFLIQGPWMFDWDRTSRSGFGRIENGALTGVNPPSLRRLALWKKAAVAVQGRPDWIFIKLHTHGMDPNDMETILGEPMQQFLRELIASAPARGETLHFVSAREMVNIVLAAADGREGNPADFRDYRYRLKSASSDDGARREAATVVKE